MVGGRGSAGRPGLDARLPREPRERFIHAPSRPVLQPDASAVSDPIEILEELADRLRARAGLVPARHVGDLGVRDDQGYFRFVGRDDDLITSGGYRIGPGEIEACLSRHPAVALAAVVGEPDPIRTEVVKAVVVLRPGFSGSEALKSDLQEYVRSRLAAHEYPRIVEFIAELPLTATGKIIRRALRTARK